jgi:hypothetical protein
MLVAWIRKFWREEANAAEQDAVIFRNCPFWTLCRIDRTRLAKGKSLIFALD